MNKSDRMSMMAERPVHEVLLRMSLPMMISFFIQAMYNIVDSMFVARISEGALTAVSLAFPMQQIVTAIAVGTSTGVSAVWSRYMGMGKTMIDVGDESLGNGLRTDRGIVGYEGEGVAIVADALDGAQTVGCDDGVDFAVDEVAEVEDALQGNNVAAADSRVHRVAVGVDPAVAIVVGREVYEIVGTLGLIVDEDVEAKGKVNVVVGFAFG